MSIKDNKRLVLRLTDELWALLAFNFQLKPEIQDDLTRIRRDAHTATAGELRDFRDHLLSNVRQAKAAFQPRVSISQFTDWFEESSRSGKGILHLPKAEIDAEYFGKFGGDAVQWAKYPH